MSEINNVIWEDLPAEVVLYNPPLKTKGGGSKITDYPISEVQVDANGDPVMDYSLGVPKMTGDTYDWSLDVDQRKLFPKYVAKILKERYDFLKVELSKGNKDVSEANRSIANQPVCLHCQIPYGTQEILDRHISEKHSNETVR